MSSPAEIERIAVRAVAAAQTAGADQAEAFCEDGIECSIRVHAGELETLEEAASRGLGVRAIADHRVGFAYTSELTDAGIGKAATEAVAVAIATDPDEFAGLPTETGSAALEALAAPDFGEADTQAKVDLALACERASLDRDPRISQVEQVIYGDSAERVCLANSDGFEGSYERTTSYAHVSAFAGQGAELMTGFDVGVGRTPSDLDPAAIGAGAADRALALLGARQSPSRRCPVVLDAQVAASLFAAIGGALCGDAVQHGRSPFVDCEGEQIASEQLTLTDDGLDSAGLGAAPFDGEGVAQRRTPLVEAGRLATYLFDSQSGRRAGRVSTGNGRRASYRGLPSPGVTNLVVSPGAAGDADLIRQAGDGLYVTQAFGLHSGINPVTGSLSVGACGVLIEAGELGRPVREVTIAGDLRSLISGIAAVGADVRWYPMGSSVCSPAVLIDEMAVSGS